MGGASRPGQRTITSDRSGRLARALDRLPVPDLAASQGTAPAGGHRRDRLPDYPTRLVSDPVNVRGHRTRRVLPVQAPWTGRGACDPPRLPGSAAGWTIAGAWLLVLRFLLKHFLKPCGVLRQLPARLAADDKRDEELADPVPFELQGDGHP